MRKEIVRSIAANHTEVVVPLRIVAIALITSAKLPAQIAACTNGDVRTNSPQSRVAVIADRINRRKSGNHLRPWIGANVDEEIHIGRDAERDRKSTRLNSSHS